MESDHALLIMQIIKGKNKHGWIMHEKLNIGPTLNFNEKLNRQSLKRNLAQSYT